MGVRIVTRQGLQLKILCQVCGGGGTSEKIGGGRSLLPTEGSDTERGTMSLKKVPRILRRNVVQGTCE